MSVRLRRCIWTWRRTSNGTCRIDIEVFVLDILGRVVFSNRAGQCLLGDGLDIVDQRLRIHAAVDAAIGQVSSRGARRATLDPKPILVERPRSHRSLAIYVLPVAGHAVAAHEFLVHAHAVVLAIDRSSIGPPDPSVVRDVFDVRRGQGCGPCWLRSLCKGDGREARNTERNCPKCPEAGVLQGRCVPAERARRAAVEACIALTLATVRGLWHFASR